MAGCHSRSCQYQCTTVPRRSRRTRRGGGVVATVLSLCNAEVLCTGAALTLDAARRAEAAAQEAAASICALALRRSCFLGPFLGLFLGPFLGPSFSAPFSPPLSENNKSALPELTDINAQDAGGGEAGSSSTEAPRTSAKEPNWQRHKRPDPPSTGNHRNSAHSLVDGEEGQLWECRDVS